MTLFKKTLIEHKTITGGTTTLAGDEPATISDLKQALAEHGVPYLVNRGDGVNGHYCIARFNSDGYTEFWHQTEKIWCSAGSVFNLGILDVIAAAQEPGK